MADTRDILILEENELGRDHIIGDVHARVHHLKIILSNLGEHDRLFICGDVIDRGLDGKGLGSQETLDYIIAVNDRRKARHQAQQIYVVKGNHESSLTTYFKARKKLNAAELRQIALLKQGSRSEQKDIEEKLIPLRKKYLSALRHLDNSKNGSKWIIYLSDIALAKNAEYIYTLPIIIHVKGAVPFNIVHSDLPFSVNELLARLKPTHPSYLKLDSAERKHAMCARKKDLFPITEENQVMTYCGHNTGESVRAYSQHFNLDFFAGNILCMINHKELTAKLIGLELYDDPVIHEKMQALLMEMRSFLGLLASHYNIKSDKLASAPNYYLLANLLKERKTEPPKPLVPPDPKKESKSPRR